MSLVELEANRRQWLEDHPGLMRALITGAAVTAAAFAAAGAYGSLHTISTAARDHGLTGWASYTPWAGAEGVLLLLTIVRVFTGMRGRPSPLAIRAGSWLAAAGAVVLNIAPSYRAADWVGMVMHLAIPAATIVGIETLEYLVRQSIAILLGAEQLLAARQEAARTVRADRWVRRSHRLAAIPGGRVLSIAPRAIARRHVEQQIAAREELLAGARARIAAFAALDCGTAAVPDDVLSPADMVQTAERFTVTRTDRESADGLEAHAADALALLAGRNAEFDADGYPPLWAPGENDPARNVLVPAQSGANANAGNGNGNGANVPAPGGAYGPAREAGTGTAEAAGQDRRDTAAAGPAAELQHGNKHQHSPFLPPDENTGAHVPGDVVRTVAEERARTAREAQRHADAAEAEREAARRWVGENPGASAAEVGKRFGRSKTWGYQRQREVQQTAANDTATNGTGTEDSEADGADTEDGES
jgi:hypothetical protein